MTDDFVDDLKIETDEDGFHLILYTSSGERHNFRLGVPEQLANEVNRTINPWIDEMDLAGASRRARRWFRQRDIRE